MQLTRFDDVQAFQDATLDFLTLNEAKNNLILGLTNGLLKHEFLEHPPYLATIDDGGQVVMVALRTPPHSLILSDVIEAYRTPEVFQLLIDDVLAEFGMIEKVNGIVEVAQPFVEQVSSITKHDYEILRSMRIYALESVIPVENVPGKLRRAEISDLDLLVEFMIGFNQDGLSTTPDKEKLRTHIRKDLENPSGIRELLLWEVDGESVSLVGYSGPTPNGIRVAPVYTPSQLRKRGYASAATAALSQMLLDGGRKFCFLYTDLANPTSNRIYMNIGYEPVCDAVDYQLTKNRSDT